MLSIERWPKGNSFNIDIDNNYQYHIIFTLSTLRANKLEATSGTRRVVQGKIPVVLKRGGQERIFSLRKMSRRKTSCGKKRAQDCDVNLGLYDERSLA